MNLLMFNLATDADDPLLSFASEWINRLAAFYDRIDVITMRSGRLITSANVCVHSVGKEKGYGEARRALEFYRILSRLRRDRPYAACFAHMMPLFALMGAPLLIGVPITLWYTHRQAHLILRLATATSQRVVTAASDSFPLKTDKLRVIGHGIDTDFFSPESSDKSASVSLSPLSACEGEGLGVRGCIIHVARLMPIKHQALLIRALPQIPNVQAVFVGDVPPGIDPAYRHELESLARDLGVADRVIFAGNQPPEGVRNWNRKATIGVNLSPIGLFDKAALEGMAVGVPTLVGSSAFDDLVHDERLKITDLDDADALAAKLSALLALSNAERCALGMSLREGVIREHSISQLIRRLVSILNTGEPA